MEQAAESKIEEGSIELKVETAKIENELVDEAYSP
jgi:hypothetical protein